MFLVLKKKQNSIFVTDLVNILQLNMYVCRLDKCNHCKHLYDLGFCFYFEMGAFFVYKFIKNKTFCKEMRFFF